MSNRQIPEAVDIGDSIVFQELKDEVVLLDMENQQYFALDSVGADAWRLLLKHKNVSEAAKGMQAAYEVAEETARRDLEVLVEELLSAGLLKKCATADPPA